MIRATGIGAVPSVGGRNVVCFAVGALFLGSLLAHESWAGPVSDAEVARLVAVINDSLEPATSGGGILIGADAEAVYVATAYHRFGRRAESSAPLQVRFAFSLDQRFSAEPAGSEPALDLAVLRVKLGPELAHQIASLPFDRLGDASALGRGDVVRSLARKSAAEVDTASGTFTDRTFTDGDGGRLHYQSKFIPAGHAGGALSNESGEVVGMVLAEGTAEGEALDVSSILPKANAWGCPVKLGALLRPAAFVALAVGEWHVCGLTNDGAVYCWGENSFGQLGNGNLVHRTRSMRVLGDHTFSALAAGENFTCGLDDRGAVYCWGHNAEGELGNRTTDNAAVPTRVATRETFRSVVAPSRGWYACGLSAAGAAYCWGSMFFVVDKDSHEPLRVGGVLTLTSLTAGHGHACGIATDGVSYCWGSWDELTRQNLNFPKPARVIGDRTFKALSAGAIHACGIGADGLAACWGRNNWGQLGNGGQSKEASMTPASVSGDHHFVALASGQAHTCGLTAEGTVYCWGENDFGQLGDGSHSDSSVPKLVGGKVRYVSISAGGARTCGLTKEGSAYCWGASSEGELGTVLPTGSAAPIAIGAVP